MIRQVLRNSQITLPKEAVRFFHLQEKDLLEVKFNRSGIHLKPVATKEFSDEEYTKLAARLDALKKAEGTIARSTQEARQHLDRMKRPEKKA